MAPVRWLLMLMAVLVVWLACGPASATPALEVYARAPEVGLMRLSPSGQRFAFISIQGDAKRLFVRQVGGEALAVENFGDVNVWQVDWAGDNQVVALVSRPEGVGKAVRERSDAIVLNLKTGKTFRVFAGRSDVQDEIAGYSGVRQVEGRWFGYFRGVSQGVQPELGLYRVDLLSGAIRRLAASNGRTAEWIIGQDGSIVARVEYDSPSQELRLLAGATGDQVLYRKARAMGQVAFQGLGRTPGTVLVRDSTGDEDVYSEISLANGATKELPQSEDVEGLIYDPLTNLLIGGRLPRNRGDLYFDPGLQARYDAARGAFPGKQVWIVSRDAGFDRLLAYTNGDRDAGTYWLVDGSPARTTRLVDVNPAIGPSDLGETRMVSYRAQDGLQMEGVLTLPPGRDPNALPLVLMPHGGPIGVEDGLGYDWWAQALASRGYAVFQPNFRGSSGYGAAFRKAAFGQWGRKMQTDLSDGVTALASQGVVDPKRVCIFGGSYGGYTALAGVTLQNGIYRCAISVSGLFDLGQRLAELGDPKSFASPQARFEQLAMGASWGGDPALKQISPVYHADKASAPILLIHGKDDSVIPVSQSEHMAAALQKAGKPYDFIVMDGDHWLSQQKTRVETLQATVAFLERWNPPD